MMIVDIITIIENSLLLNPNKIIISNYKTNLTDEIKEYFSFEKSIFF